MNTNAQENKPAIQILECGGVTPKGSVSLLCEVFSGDIRIVDDPYRVERRVNESGETELVETRVKDGPLKIAGTFQCEGLRNANKRVYPIGLWEKHTAKGSPLMEKIAARRCIGEIEHPANGVGHLRNTAVLVTNVTMGKLEADGTRKVYGEAEITDTPDGRIVRDLIRSNVKIGVSSRATGVVDEKGMVEESTFNPITWDIVANPSTPGAFPNVMKESVNESANTDECTVGIKSLVCENGDMRWQVIDPQGRVVRQVQLVRENTVSGDTNMASSKDRLKALTEQFQAHKDAALRESDPVKRSRLDSVLIDLSTSVAQLIKEDATLDASGGFLQDQITETRKALAEPVAETQPEFDSDDQLDEVRKTQVNGKTFHRPEVKGKSGQSRLGGLYASGARAENVEKRFDRRFGKKDDSVIPDSDQEHIMEEDGIDEVSQLDYANHLLELAKNELLEKEEVITALTEALEAQEAELAEALADADAAKKMLAEVTSSEDPKAKALKDVVENAIKENANLEPLRAILSAQPDIESVNKIVEAVAKPAKKTTATNESTLPTSNVKDSKDSQELRESSSNTVSNALVESVRRVVARRGEALTGNLRVRAN